MTRYLFPLLFALSALGADFADRVPCEVSGDGSALALKALRWQQGITPLVQFDQLSNGKAVVADTGVVARMIIGQTATGTLYAVTNSYAVTNNSFLVQWGTVATNSGTGKWWYTVYFEKAGHRYWAGNGDLYITRTTSTDADGLNWQTLTTNATDQTARDAAAAARVIATNALALAQAQEADSAFTNWTATNNYVKAESDPLALPVAQAATNANTIHAALSSTAHGGVISGATATQIWGTIAATGTVFHALTADALSLGAGVEGSFSVDASNLYLYTVTNTMEAYVSAVSSTNPALYNGPRLGTIFTNYHFQIGEPPPEGYFWDESAGFVFEYSVQLGGYRVIKNEVEHFLKNSDWAGLPVTLQGDGLIGTGTLTIAWVPVTNTTTIAISSLVGAEYGGVPIEATDGVLDLDRFTTNGQPHTVTLTNLTTIADGVLGGTNGIYFTKSLTNYWILLP